MTIFVSMVLATLAIITFLSRSTGSTWAEAAYECILVIIGSVLFGIVALFVTLTEAIPV